MKSNKITIEWYSIVKDVIKNLWLVFLAVLIAFMGMFIVSHKVYEPAYTSTATLVVTPRGASTGSSISKLSIANEMAEVLVNIFAEPAMKGKAVEYMQTDGFNGEIFAAVMPGTNFIELNVTSSNPQTAYDLLSAVLKVYPQISEEIFSNANISVVRMPSMPSAPSNNISNENKNLILVGVATVVLAAIVVISILRDTVKNENAFNEKIGEVLLGTVLHEKKRVSLKDILNNKKKSLLIKNNAFLSLKFSENFHKIAARLEHINRKDGAKVFAVTSVAENEGKSTCAANIAVALVNKGHKVVLVDLDCKKPALYKIFNQKYELNSELGNLFDKKILNKEFKFKKHKRSSLYLAFNTKPYSYYYDWIENGEIAKFIDLIKSKSDFVIIDCAPVSCDSAVTSITSIADKSILVVRTDVVLSSSINETIDTIDKISDNFLGCILNDVHPNILPFSFTGDDDGGYYNGKYSYYGKYGKYDNNFYFTNNGRNTNKESFENESIQ